MSGSEANYPTTASAGFTITKGLPEPATETTGWATFDVELEEKATEVRSWLAALGQSLNQLVADELQGGGSPWNGTTFPHNVPVGILGWWHSGVIALQWASRLCNPRGLEHRTILRAGAYSGKVRLGIFPRRRRLRVLPNWRLSLGH